MNVKDLKKFLKDEEIEADFYEFKNPTLSVEDSAEQLEVGPERIVKSLVFKDEDGNPILAVVSGVKRVDEKKLSKAHGSEVRMVKAREVEEFTGYKIGEVSPVGTGLETYVDEEISEFEKVIAGGGSTHTLIELNTEDIVKSSGAELAKIS